MLEPDWAKAVKARRRQTLGPFVTYVEESILTLTPPVSKYQK